MTSIAEIVKTIHPEKTIFFFGAGISNDSGIPLANEIKKQLLIHFVPNQVDRELILQSKIPFELLMEIILKDSRFDGIFNVFKSEYPNANHFLFAELAKHFGKLKMITTNFDTLIEQAAENCETPSSCYDFHKIHGSLSNIKSLAVTLKNVARHRNVQSIKTFLEKLLNDKQFEFIIFLGYSFSDSFDITPALLQIRTSHLQPIVISHNGKGDLIEPIFKEPALKYFGKGCVVNINTTDFIHEYWNQYLTTPYKAIEAVKNDDYIAIINTFAGKFSKNRKTQTAAALLSEIGDFRRSAHYFNLIDIDLEKDKQKEKIYADIGVNFRILDQYDSALKMHEKALQLAIKQKNKGAIVSDYNNIAVVYEDIGNYPEAVKQLDNCFNDPSLAKIANWDEVLLGNYARFLFGLSEFDRGFPFAMRAIKISRRKGRKRQEGRLLGSLGNGYFYQNKLKEAAAYFGQAKDIAVLLDDREGVIIMLNNVAACQIYLKDYGEALKIYDELIALDGIKGLDSVSSSNYAFALYQAGQSKRGFYFIKRAIRLATQKKEVDSIAGCKLIHARMLFKNKPSLAITRLKDAESFFREFKNINRLSITLQLMGDIYVRKKDVKSACECYRESLSFSNVVWGEHSKESAEINEKLKPIEIRG
ncbi:MAG: SIR2 family protein [Mucilaginibacter sp.]